MQRDQETLAVPGRCFEVLDGRLPEAFEPRVAAGELFEHGSLVAEIETHELRIAINNEYIVLLCEGHRVFDSGITGAKHADTFVAVCRGVI